jgi:hypothetical protein
MIDISSHFGSLLALASAVTLITGWVNTYVTGLSGWKTQLLSWGIAIGLSFLGAWQDLGIFAEADLLSTLLNGIGVGLVANGIFSAEFVQQILVFAKAKKV